MQELGLTVQEDEVHARLAPGRQAEQCGELSALTERHPLRERPALREALGTAHGCCQGAHRAGPHRARPRGSRARPAGP
ncbi:hypothetical protein [Saccharothrix saharensis]|uniref:hypothetical protein n=1 Tax=Saccharothrix saharensis TaxID=571190 RepID=UPI001154DB50|nr:hypothetical protein [Saccharothrix saharensis]